MPEFFKPWRRKFGVVTLLMACVFAAGWVRSQRYDDVLQLRLSGRYALFFWSTESVVVWQSVHDTKARLDTLQSIAYIGMVHKVYRDRGRHMQQMPSASDFERSFVFKAAPADVNKFAEDVVPGLQVRAYVAPTWWLILPLTLVAAGLLLSKPPLAKKPEPTSATGT